MYAVTYLTQILILFDLLWLVLHHQVCSSDISAGLLLHAPSLHDHDQREMFCFTLFPGSDLCRKVS